MKFLYRPLYPEYVPPDADDNHITPEEEADLLRSWTDLRKGNVTVVPRSCTDEDLIKMLEM